MIMRNVDFGGKCFKFLRRFESYTNLYQHAYGLSERVQRMMHLHFVSLLEVQYPYMTCKAIAWEEPYRLFAAMGVRVIANEGEMEHRIYCVCCRDWMAVS